MWPNQGLIPISLTIHKSQINNPTCNNFLYFLTGTDDCDYTDYEKAQDFEMARASDFF